MKITWLGHSCFKIENNGYSIIIDPYTDESVRGLKPIRERANAVYFSHEHGDHHGDNCVKIIENVTSNPFSVEEIATYHDEVHGAKRGLNKIYIFDDGKTKIAHFGDLGCELEAAQKEKLKKADVLLIPVGGYYTIGHKQAAELVSELKPRVVIPMHYRDDERGIGFDEIDTVSDFTEDMDSVMVIQSSELDVTYELSAQVVIMQPLNAM